MEFPRRINMDQWTYAERMIAHAVAAVENLPADERLTRAVICLQSAREYVADFVDGVPLDDEAAATGAAAREEE